MAKKRNKSLEEIFKGTGVNISSTQPTSVAQQNQAIQKQGSWGNSGSTGGTRIVGTGGGTMQHTDAGAQKVAALSGSKYSKTGAVVDAFSRGVGKTTKTNNAATAFKPAPVMSKPKQTKQDRLATVSAELDEMRNQRTQLVKDSVGKKAQTQKITELNSRIQKAKDEQKKLEKDVYGYTGNFFSDTAKRIGRTLSGATQSVVGTAAETVGQIGRFGADADDPRIYATTGAMINEARNPGALQRQHQAVQGRVQGAFDTSDKFAEESAQNIESAKGGLGTLGKLAVDVGSEGLKLAGDMALNTVAPGSGLAAMGVRAFGGGAQEARQAGATGDQQFLYGASTAGIEMLTEKMFSAALPFKQAYGGAARVGGKTLDDAMDAVISKVVKSPAVRALAHNFIGEGIEEQASDLLNPVAKLIYDKDAVHDTYLTAEGRQQLAEDLLRDGLVGAILGGLGATGNVVSNVAVGNRLLKNGGSGAANVLASAASFPEQSEAHKTATELIERHDQGGKITPYELGDLVHQMQEAAAKGVYPDEMGGTYEVLRDTKGNWRVVHQINETAQALNEKGVDTKDAIKYAAVLDSLAQNDDMSVSQVKRKLDVFSPAVREQVEQMTGRALPEATSKADTARAIKAAFTEYRAEVEEEERLAEAEQQAAAEAEERAAIVEESDAEAAQFMEQAVAEQEQAVAQEQAQQAQQQQQAEEPQLVQPLETLEEFLSRKEEDATRRYGEGLSEEERKELTKAWEQSTKNDGIRLDDGTTIGFAEFAEVMRPYLSKEEGYTVSDSKLMAAFNKFRAASAEQPISRATWEKNIAATRGDTSAQPESVTAEETAEEEPGASVLSAEEETAPVEETPAEEPAATVLSVAEESSPVEESAPKAEEKPAEKKPTQQKKTRQKKQTVIPTKAEAEAAKTATQSAETAEEVGDLAESIQNAIKVLRESGAKTQRDVFDSTGKSAKESVRLSQAYWLLQDNGLISVKSDGSFTIKNTAKKGGVKHSLSSNPNIQTNENVTLEQRLAAEFLMEHLQGKGIKGIVFDGKNLEGENGHIDKKSGIVYLNENYLDTAMAVAQTVGHEIFHAGAEGDAQLVNSMLESAKKLVDEGKLTGRNGYYAARWLKDIDAEVERRAADYRAFLEANGADAATIAEETSPEAMREEIACDLMGMVLNNQSALDTIAQTEPTLLDRIIEALDRLLGGRYSRMANYATGGEDTSFAQYGKDYADTVKELDKIAERLSTALDNYRDGTRVVEPSELENSDARTLTEDMGDGTVVEADENGDLVFAQNKAEHSTAFSLATWQVGQAKLRRALEEEGHSKEEIDDIINRVDSIAEFIEDLGDEYAEMGYDKLKNNLIADIVTDVRTGKQVLSALVKNGDYPVNFDLALICKKRVAYMNLISRLVKDGVMDKVTFGAEAIAKVNEILRDRGFETACLGCFVESRRLQIQKWAETIVKEWNEEVDKRTKNAPDFGFAKGKNAELTVDDLAAIQQEYEGVDLNEKGNKKLKQASVKNKMGQLLNTTPSLLKHLTVEDLLTPQGISALRQRDGSLFSLVQQRYGAASPKIVQDFNPYNGEIADLSFEFVKDRFGDGIKGKDAYIADAKAELAVEEGGLPAKQKGESKEDFEKRKAEFNTRAENMAIRQYLYDIGGARIQSFSDFMIENVFDYIQIYADLAARKFPMHGYTKEIIALRLFGLTGQKWNGSLIAHTERSQGKKLAGLLPVEEAKNGHGIVVTDPMTGEQYAICFDDYQRNKRTKGTENESFIQSIGMKDIFALQLDSRYSPFVGSITIGVSDAQIRAMLNHPLFSMVIPYHKSGMLPMYAELVGVDMYNDYTDYQNTRVGAVYGKDGKPLTRAVDLDGNPIPPKTVKGKKVDYAPGVYKKDDKGWKRVSADTHYDFNAKVQELGDAKAAAQAYVDWCYEDHPIYNGDDVVGYETFLPKFSDSPEGYDFTQEENYYKLLEDFVSYDTVTGEPVLQGDVQMSFPEADSLSADELDAYKQRLRDTGLYTAKEIERYAEKAQMGFKDIVREALNERKQYHDATDPQWEDTVSQVTNALLGDDHLRSTPVERQKAWKKEDKAAKKAEKQKGIKHSLRRPVEGMYNLSERVIENLPDGKIAVNQLMKKLSGGGVNADELHWLGIEDFVRGKKSVDKQELLDYIRANDLVIEEETLTSTGPGYAYIMPDRSVSYESWGDAKDGAETLAKINGYSEDDVKYDNLRGVFYVYDPEAEEEEILVREFDPEKDGRRWNETNWSQYALTGGSNYREILFRLPGSDYQNDGSTRHWESKAPGVLAHARVQDFPTADGVGKILFVEEIQSDWHNRGLKHGYIRDTDDPAEVQSQLDRKYQEDLAKWEKQHREIEDAIHALYRENGVRDIDYLFRQVVRMNKSELAQHVEEDGPDSLSQLYSIFYSDDPDSAYSNSPISEDEIDALGMYYELLNERHRVNRKRPDNYYYKVSQMAPDAPYKDTYQNFVMKRLVREAEQKGYDGIAWTTGQMQVDRWDEKYRKAYELEYDKQIPKFLNKFGKPFGAKVETTQIETGDGLVTVPYFALNMPLRRSVRNDGMVKFSLPSKDGKSSTEENAIYIKDGHTADGTTVDFISAILDGKKKGETRSHKGLTRKWVGMAKDGKVYGRVRLGNPTPLEKGTPEYTDSLIEGTEYDIKPGETKYYYPVLEVEDFRENPLPILRNGNYGRYDRTPSPISAFTEKGRKYSVRGQVPEFDAIFDFYANYGLTNDAPKAPPKPQVSRVRSKTYERMGVPRSFDEEHRQALDESEFEYDPIAEQESMRRAEERLTNDYEGEKKDLSKRNWRNGEDLDTAMGILATELNLAKETGDYDETIEWLHLIREQGTKAGQFIQAFAKYNRSPEGILARAVDDLEKSKLSSDERKELIQKITDFAATLSKLRPKADGSVDPNALVDLIVQQAKQRNTKVSKGSMKVLQRLVNEGDVQYLYNFALTQLDQIAKDYIPASLGRKVGTYQTISHLLNLRTGNRNLVSNTAFGSIAATANNVAMLPDAVFGLLTGNGRMVGLDRGHLSKETWRGIKEGGARARLGINLDVQPDTNARDKYGTSKRTWKMAGNFVQRQMSRVEKLMAYELNWTDEFRKGGVRAEIIQSLAPMVANGSISMEVAKEWAEQEALYRTFQDDTYVNKLLGNVKKLLNMKLVSEVDANGKKTYHIGQMDFGLGDIVQKYTQVPGALITRAIELSPAGYLKAIYLMGSMAKTASASKQAKTAYEVAKQTAAKSDKERLKRAANRAFEKSVKADVVAKSAQRDAALALGRAITGTGLIAAFAALAKAGLLKRADDEDDPDAKALKAAEGITGTQLNLSAIRRLINGESPEWRQGDVLASVEFLEPMNNEMTMGAKIAKSIAGGKNDLGTFTLDTFDALYQSMQEIPTMQTLQTINQTIQYHKEDDPLPVWAEIPIEIARSGVTGFVPSLVRQTAQASDPYYRDAYTSRDIGDQIKDTVKNAIPGLRQQLPVKLDNFGRKKEQEEQPLNALNAFFIPGSVRTYQQSKATGKLQTLYDQTGKANIFPDRSAPYNVSYSVDKQQTKFDLTPEERQKYQTTRGQVTLKTLVAAMDDMWYQNASADQKVEIVEKAKAYGNYKAKVEADAKQAQREGRLDVYSDSEYEHIDTALNMGYNMSNYLLVKEKCNSFTADKNANGKSISGSKMKKIIEYLNSLNLTDQQKAYMFELTSGSNKTPFGSY